MKTTVNLPTPKSTAAYSESQAKPGRLYKTANGSIVFKPNAGLSVPSGYYVTLVHFANPAMNMALRSFRGTRFPWVEVDAGATVTLAQE